MDLIKIIEQGARTTRASGFTVDVDSAYSWITIKNEDTHEGVFLQGDEAESFIIDADNLYNKTGTLTYDVICEYLAEKYMEIVE